MNVEFHALPDDGPSRDVVFTVLSDPRRRRIVRALAERDAPVSLKGLAASVADRDPEASPDAPARDLATAMHHVHLPYLDDADVVDYHAESRTVTDVRTASIGTILSEDSRANVHSSSA